LKLDMSWYFWWMTNFPRYDVRSEAGRTDFAFATFLQEHITIEFPSTLTSQIKIFIVEYYIPWGHPRSRNSLMNILISI
jgi:hypothetical protein